MAKKGNHICGKCGKDCGNPPALALHENYCKVEKKKVAVAAACDHNFRLLNPRSMVEEKALQDGYLKVCIKCQDIEK